MKWFLIIGGCVFGLLLFVGIGLFATGSSLYNKNVSLTTLYKAQEKANEVIYDKVWKTISQKAQIADGASDKFKEIYTDIMSKRYEGKDPLMNWIQEQNPNFDISLYKDLSLSIESLRSEFTNVQIKLIDIHREQNLLISTFPNNIFCMVLNIKPLELKLVTSGKTNNAFKTGQDNDVELFNNGKVEK